MPKRSKQDIITAAIKRGKTNQEALDAVLKVYPGSKMALATVNYYRNDLRKKDKTIKSATAQRARR